MNFRKNILPRLSTTCIVASLCGLIFTFYPVISIYLFPPQLSPVASKGYFITIPKIHAEAPIILNVDPWNESIYRQALKLGVAQAKGSQLPGKQGTSYLFAHSSGMPWEITRYNSIFLRLPELIANDRIIITVDGKHYKYKVTGKKEVPPTDVSYLVASPKNQLILQTCVPIGTSLNRLLVFATPV